METINIHAAKTHLSKLIVRALAGEEIVISKNGEPLVDIIRHKNKEIKKPRRGGQWTGKVWYAPDYDEADAIIEKIFNESEIFPKD